MKHVLFSILTVFIFSHNLLAQGSPPRSDFDPSKMTSGGIMGVVSSGEDESLIAYANIVVRDSIDKLINGVITNEEGKFMVKKIPFNQTVKLEISFIGFQTITQHIVLTKENPFHKAGNIVLLPDTELLKEVQVKGEKAIIQTSLDKKTYNVDKSTITKSKSASDVLNELPSVDVEADGTISLRGNSNVRILVDGESSLASSGNIELILQQIPAESIEKIDVVTNPSAKYDPEGTSGVINIILKKEKQRGVNGTVSAGVGTWNKYNAATFISYRKNKFGLTANYNFRYNDSYSESFSERTTDSLGNVDVIKQTGEAENDNMSHFGRIGLSFSPNKKNTISFGALSNFFKYSRDGDSKSHFTFDDDSAEADTESDDIHNGNGVFSNFNLYHNVKFKKESADFKYGANFSKFNGEFDGGYVRDSIVSNGTLLLEARNTEVDAISHTLDVPFDFTIPVNDAITQEFGFKSSIIWRFSDFTSESKDNLSDQFETEYDLQYDFNYNEKIFAAYGNHIHSIKNFSYQIGLRLEEVLIDAEVMSISDGLQAFDRTYFAWYPSVFVRQGFGDKEKGLHEVQLSYSKRINRPHFRIVNPYRDFSDPNNPREGNPFLLPEFINSLELGYNKVWEKVTFNSSLFYKLTTDYYSRFQVDLGAGVQLTTYENVGSLHEYGFELINKYKVTDWWDIGVDFNIAKNQYTGGSFIREGDTITISSNDNLTYGGKATSTMDVWKGLEIQITGRYRGPRLTTQGQRDGYGTLDFALKQSILKNKGSISFTANDLTNTRKRGSSSSVGDGTTTITTISENKRESRIFWLTFSYGFGKMGEMFNKRAGRNNRGGDDDGGDEGVF